MCVTRAAKGKFIFALLQYSRMGSECIIQYHVKAEGLRLRLIEWGNRNRVHAIIDVAKGVTGKTG